MKKTFWLLLALGAGLTFLSTRPTRSACVDCQPGLLSLPDDVLAHWSAPGPMNLPYPAPPAREDWRALPAQDRLASAHARVRAPLEALLHQKGMKAGAPVFIRIFKETRELQLWLQTGSQWRLFRTYPVAAMSGGPGPKFMEGDQQAPEGFYAVAQQAMNPASAFHLSFNIGYPNAYDRHHGRTGSLIMIHGNEVSVGCFAMTDPVIEEIYLLVEAALAAGQTEVPVHIFPFPRTDSRLARASDDPSAKFWHELQPGYLAFEKTHSPPKVLIQGGRYILPE